MRLGVPSKEGAVVTEKEARGNVVVTVTGGELGRVMVVGVLFMFEKEESLVSMPGCEEEVPS